MIRFAMLILCAVIHVANAQEYRDRAPMNMRMLPGTQAPVDSAADAPRVFETVVFRLVLGNDGRIRDIEPHPGQSPALVNEVQSRVVSWRFGAALRDGSPVSAQTTLYVHLVGERQQGGEYAMRIERANTGPGAIRRVTPRYPPVAVRAMRTGAVLIRARYDAAGKVTEAHALHDVSDSAFERAALTAVKGWEFEPEKLDGVAQPGSLLIPVVFRLLGEPMPDLGWKATHPGIGTDPAPESSLIALLENPAAGQEAIR